MTQFTSLITPAVTEQFKSLGFALRLQRKTAELVIGRIAAEKPDELEKLPAVVCVAPAS